MKEVQAQKIHQVMHIYIQQLNEALEIFEQERAALVERDLKRFQEIIQKKECVLNEIANFDASLNSLLKPLSQDKSQMQHIFSQHQGPLRQSLVLQWQALQRAAKSCRRANEVNSQILAHSQQHYTRLLALLRNTDPNLAIYGKKGYTSASASQVCLAQA